jgi:hypothetical protein
VNEFHQELNPVWRPEQTGCSRTAPAPHLDEYDEMTPDDEDPSYEGPAFGFNPRR